MLSAESNAIGIDRSDATRAELGDIVFLCNLRERFFRFGFKLLFRLRSLEFQHGAILFRCFRKYCNVIAAIARLMVRTHIVFRHEERREAEHEAVVECFLVRHVERARENFQIVRQAFLHAHNIARQE